MCRCDHEISISRNGQNYDARGYRDAILGLRLKWSYGKAIRSQCRLISRNAEYRVNTKRYRMSRLIMILM